MVDLTNLLEIEQELFRLLESRERLVVELKKLDKDIDKLKGLILHRMEANNLIVGNLFEMINLNLEKPILLKDIKDVLPNERLLLNGIVAKVDYKHTTLMLNNLGIKGLQAQSVIKQIKSLQSDYYKELKIKGKAI